MTTIYLVRNDEYDDTSTVAVFTDEATATLYRETLDPHAVVEPMTVNEWTPGTIADERVRRDFQNAQRERERAERQATYEERREAGTLTYQDMLDRVDDLQALTTSIAYGKMLGATTINWGQRSAPTTEAPDGQ